MHIAFDYCKPAKTASCPKMTAAFWDANRFLNIEHSNRLRLLLMQAAQSLCTTCCSEYRSRRIWNKVGHSTGPTHTSKKCCVKLRNARKMLWFHFKWLKVLTMCAGCKQVMLNLTNIVNMNACSQSLAILA